MITKKRLTIVFSLIVGLLMCLPMTTYADSSDSSNTSGNLPSNLGNYDKGEGLQIVSWNLTDSFGDAALPDAAKSSDFFPSNRGDGAVDPSGVYSLFSNSVTDMQKDESSSDKKTGMSVGSSLIGIGMDSTLGASQNNYSASYSFKTIDLIGKRIDQTSPLDKNGEYSAEKGLDGFIVFRNSLSQQKVLVASANGTTSKQTGIEKAVNILNQVSGGIFDVMDKIFLLLMNIAKNLNPFVLFDHFSLFGSLGGNSSLNNFITPIFNSMGWLGQFARSAVFTGLLFGIIFLSGLYAIMKTGRVSKGVLKIAMYIGVGLALIPLAGTLYTNAINSQIKHVSNESLSSDMTLSDYLDVQDWALNCNFALPAGMKYDPSVGFTPSLVKAINEMAKPKAYRSKSDDDYANYIKKQYTSQTTFSPSSYSSYVNGIFGDSASKSYSSRILHSKNLTTEEVLSNKPSKDNKSYGDYSSSALITRGGLTYSTTNQNGVFSQPEPALDATGTYSTGLSYVGTYNLLAGDGDNGNFTITNSFLSGFGGNKSYSSVVLPGASGVLSLLSDSLGSWSLIVLYFSMLLILGKIIIEGFYRGFVDGFKSLFGSFSSMVTLSFYVLTTVVFVLVFYTVIDFGHNFITMLFSIGDSISNGSKVTYFPTTSAHFWQPGKKISNEISQMANSVIGGLLKTSLNLFIFFFILKNIKSLGSKLYDFLSQTSEGISSLIIGAFNGISSGKFSPAYSGSGGNFTNSSKSGNNSNSRGKEDKADALDKKEKEAEEAEDKAKKNKEKLESGLFGAAVGSALTKHNNNNNNNNNKDDVNNKNDVNNEDENNSVSTEQAGDENTTPIENLKTSEHEGDLNEKNQEVDDSQNSEQLEQPNEQVLDSGQDNQQATEAEKLDANSPDSGNSANSAQSSSSSDFLKTPKSSSSSDSSKTSKSNNVGENGVQLSRDKKNSGKINHALNVKDRKIGRDVKNNDKIHQKEVKKVKHHASLEPMKNRVNNIKAAGRAFHKISNGDFKGAYQEKNNIHSTTKVKQLTERKKKALIAKSKSERDLNNHLSVKKHNINSVRKINNINKEK